MKVRIARHINMIVWIGNVFLIAFLGMGYVLGYNSPLTLLFTLSTLYIFVHYVEKYVRKKKIQ